MSRTFAMLLASFVSVLLATKAFAAEPDRPRAARPMWGTVTKTTADSITIAPELAVRRNRKAPEAPPEKPAEQTFALSKDQTEFMFAEVGMKRLMNDGTTLRTLTEPEPAAAADLKAGQLIEVTPGDGDGDAAKRVVIAWSVPGTIVKVDGDALTFRPADADAAPKQGADDNHADEQTLTVSRTATRVEIAQVADERPAPNGRGLVQSIEYKPATVADLKPDQSVVICIRNETAVKIRIYVAPEKP